MSDDFESPKGSAADLAERPARDDTVTPAAGGDRTSWRDRRQERRRQRGDGAAQVITIVDLLAAPADSIRARPDVDIDPAIVPAGNGTKNGNDAATDIGHDQGNGNNTSNGNAVINREIQPRQQQRQR